MPTKLSWQMKKRVPYCITAWEINQAYYFDGFCPMVIEGKQRIARAPEGAVIVKNLLLINIGYVKAMVIEVVHISPIRGR